MIDICYEGRKELYPFSLELSAALWYNDANNLIRCGGLADMMWLATGRVSSNPTPFGKSFDFFAALTAFLQQNRRFCAKNGIFCVFGKILY